MGCSIRGSPDRIPPTPLLLFVLKFCGWAIARTPELVLRGVAAALGRFMFIALRRRRRLILSNLHHAFPDRPEAWRRRVGRESCRRMVETGLLSLATPHLSEARVRQIGRGHGSWADFAASIGRAPKAHVLATPHLAYWESQTWMKFLSAAPTPEIGVIYRPLDNPAADQYVKTSRERFGMRLLSRKAGFAEAQKILRANGCVAILFDQNAGMQGALTLLLDRVCSTTELPGLLAAKFHADVKVVYPRRLGFWRLQVEVVPLAHDGTVEGVTIALNRWLETALRDDEELCASWLWAHDRWRHQDIPERRFRLESKRDLLQPSVAARGLARLPRRTRIWVRLPNWLGDVVMALPLLRALRASRPDAELTLVAKPAFLPLLREWAVADQLHALPPRGMQYWRHFARLRRQHVDVWLLFTNSWRGDLEAWLSGARHRFGVLRAGKRRPLLTHAYAVPADFDERTRHQIELWQAFLARFGLDAPPDRSPLSAGGSAPGDCIGLIPGSENTPAKRWPAPHWRALIDALPHARFRVLGTPNDRAIAETVCADYPAGRVENLAGKTNLLEFVTRLGECRALVTNDTGGMHLANALGVPLIAVFGPTNPVRTGPVFAGEARILQPPGCPPTGGGSLANLAPAAVAAELEALLQSTSAPRPASHPARP